MFALVGEDLALDLLDVHVHPLGGDSVSVDDVVEDRVERHPRPVPEQLRPPLDPLADLAQATVAVADGDDEAGVDEEHQLADLDHLLGVHVAGGLDDDEQGLAVELDLGPLVGLDRVLDRQLVEVELAGDRLELLRRRFDDAEPDEAPVVALGGGARLVEGEVVAAATVLVDGAVDDHTGSIARRWAGYRIPASRSAALTSLARRAMRGSATALKRSLPLR